MIIDLCCGQGRFESPNEEVISIDIQRKCKPTIIADIRYLPLKADLKPRLCHASPPCKYFSQQRLGNWGHHEKGIAESLRLVAACFDAFYHLKPITWTLENPDGMMKKFVGPALIKLKYNRKRCHEGDNSEYDTKPTCFWSNDRSLRRALIPQDVRQKILEATNYTRIEAEGER